MWMPAADDDAAALERAQRGRDELAGGGEDDRRVERLRRPGSSASPAHSQPSSRAKRLRGLVAGAREREHAPALVERDLGDDVRRGAEAVERRARAASPATRSARWPISPAHSSGATSASA